jgi:gamma-glutamylcysteine synthetase
MANHSTVITDTAQLVDWVAAGAKPKADWRIGTEHEKILFHRADFRPVAYDGADGVGALLGSLCSQIGEKSQPIMEKGQIIGLKDGDGGSVTLEPGGQLELSGAPLVNLHQTCAETGRHLKHMRTVTTALGLGMLGVGYQPKWARHDIPWMPKGRYKIMRDHMPKVGRFGLDMMLRSCTVQVNLDYSDEPDMRRKFRTSLALQPVATALFANSPFRDGETIRLAVDPRPRLGPTPIMRGAGCRPVSLMRVSVISNGSITFLMCPCIFCIAAKIISMWPDSHSAIIWRHALPGSKVCRRIWQILKTISPPHSPKSD